MKVDLVDGQRSVEGGQAPYNILFVFPRFNPNSFWALADTCRIAGVRCTAPPLGLMTLAALLPQTWNMRLVNRNCQSLTDADLEWADIVMSGGMLPQADDTFEVMRLVRAKGIPIAIGGPDPTSRPDIYKSADFLVLGEAEGVIGEFVEAWCRGERSGRFEAAKFQADVTKSPVPRYDLIDFKHYLYVGLQFSRGLP